MSWSEFIPSAIEQIKVGVTRQFAKRTQHHCWDIPVQEASPRSVVRERPTNPDWGLCWLEASQCQGRIKERLEEPKTEEIAQLNTTCDSGSNPFAMKDIIGTTGETCMGSKDSTGLVHPFPDLGGCVTVMQKAHGGTCPCFQAIHTDRLRAERWAWLSNGSGEKRLLYCACYF